MIMAGSAAEAAPIARDLPLSHPGVVRRLGVQRGNPLVLAITVLGHAATPLLGISLRWRSALRLTGGCGYRSRRPRLADPAGRWFPCACMGSRDAGGSRIGWAQANFRPSSKRPVNILACVQRQVPSAYFAARKPLSAICARPHQGTGARREQCMLAVLPPAPPLRSLMAACAADRHGSRRRCHGTHRYTAICQAARPAAAGATRLGPYGATVDARNI